MPLTYDDLATTTIEKRSRKLADNLSENTALMFRLKEKGNIRTFSGGRVIEEELMFSGPGNFQYYQGYDTLGTSQGDMLTMAEFGIKQAAVVVSMSGLEELQNDGPEKFIDLFGGRLDAAEKEMMNNLSTGIYSDGTGSGGKQIGGLQLLVSDDGTGTVGGIVSGTYTWWKNQFYDFSVNSVTPSAATITPAMNSLYDQCSRNRDVPDLIVADRVYFNYYLESLQPLQRFTNEKMADAGFWNLRYRNADVVSDGGLGGDAPASHMYMLNTDTIFWRPHARRNMVALDPKRYAVNQDAFARIIAFAGNLTVNTRRLNGVIVA